MKSKKNVLERITVNPDICHGKPVIRNKRYPVETILEYLAGGDSIEDILKEFGDLEKEDILACLAYATKMICGKSIKIRENEIYS
ncbi:MAG: DUF433 domain-containing protein [Bacteroidia bacterium]|nr:DUF433 domain-containing protein [Bacteroidia bacterium]